MHLYWEGKEGERPPPDATFYLSPFSPPHFTPLSPVQVPLPPPLLQPLKILRATLHPDREGWIERVNRAKEAIRRGELEKVVLARTCTLELEEAPCPFAVTAKLRKRKEGAILFCLQRGEEAILGATPERLFRREGRRLIAEAIAGTRKKESSENLLTSPKDLLEHAPIPRALQQLLTPFCTAPPTLSPLTTCTTAAVRHLYQEVHGKAREEIDDLSLALALHPTPALGGWPKPQALSLLSSLEPFERGLYGGVLGWKSGEQSEWAVLLRCLHLQGKKGTLTTGTGIVLDSDPEEEWEELNAKLSLYRELLGDNIECGASAPS